MSTWNIVLFLMALLVSAGLVAVATLQVNAFEQKLNQFILKIKNRYDLEKLKAALEEEKRIRAEKIKTRKGANP
jgi:hypothetical protein